MAYTSVIPVRRLDWAVKYVMNKEKTTAVSLQDALDYAANRDKTEQSCFESSYACTLETAFADMRQTKERWHKSGGVQGYHLVQSFAAGEVSPELAHQIAKELADRVLGGQYEYVIGTHLNTDHIHSHIVWNSVSCVDGKKYRSNYKSYVTEIRAVSDELCRKYKLSIIDTENSNHVAKPYAEWLAEKNNQPTWRTAIRQDVDEAIQQSLTWRQFLTVLDRKGYEVRMGRKYPILRPPGKERFVRFKTLGKRYTPEAIQTLILYPRSYRPYVENPPTIQHGRLHSGKKPHRKLTGLRALYYRYLYELGALPRKPRRPSYAVRQDAYKLDQRIREMEFLENNHEGIVTKQTFREAQAEIARRNSKSATNHRKRHRGRYNSKYALSERLVCGDCGSSYKRVTWSIHGRKQIVWRCVNRLEYGTKFCSNSPSIPETELHQAILKAVQNLAAKFTGEVADQLNGILHQIEVGESLTPQLQAQLEQNQQEFDHLLEMSLDFDENTPFLDDKLKRLSDKIKQLKTAITQSSVNSQTPSTPTNPITAKDLLITEYDDMLTARIIEKIIVKSRQDLEIIFIGGYTQQISLQ